MWLMSRKMSNNIMNNMSFRITEKYTLHTYKSQKISFQVFQNFTRAKLFNDSCVKTAMIDRLKDIKISS